MISITASLVSIVIGTILYSEIGKCDIYIERSMIVANIVYSFLKLVCIMTHKNLSDWICVYVCV